MTMTHTEALEALADAVRVIVADKWTRADHREVLEAHLTNLDEHALPRKREPMPRFTVARHDGFGRNYGPERTYFLAGYWNAERGNIAIVAVLNNAVGDWAAYIGGVRGMPVSEVVLDVADHGAKLPEADALRWFGDEAALTGAPRGYRG